MSPKHLLDENIDHALEVAEGYVFIDHQTLDLMKHGGVGDIRITAVNFSRSDDAERRLLVFHDVNLHRRGVRPQNHILFNIKGVLHIAGGVILGDIQGFKIIIIGFDFGSFFDLESQTVKNGGDFF